MKKMKMGIIIGIISKFLSIILYGIISYIIIKFFHKKLSRLVIKNFNNYTPDKYKEGLRIFELMTFDGIYFTYDLYGFNGGRYLFNVASSLDDYVPENLFRIYVKFEDLGYMDNVKIFWTSLKSYIICKIDNRLPTLLKKIEKVSEKTRMSVIEQSYPYWAIKNNKINIL